MKKFWFLQRAAAVAVFLELLGPQVHEGIGTANAAGREDAPSVAIDHTLSGVAYKTFAAPLETMRSAALTGLGQLEFDVTADVSAGPGRKIEATASKRRILIELESLGSSATLMQVTAERTTGIFRDRATATEIIVRTASVLDGRRHASAGH